MCAKVDLNWSIWISRSNCHFKALNFYVQVPKHSPFNLRHIINSLQKELTLGPSFLNLPLEPSNTPEVGRPCRFKEMHNSCIMRDHVAHAHQSKMAMAWKHVSSNIRLRCQIQVSRISLNSWFTFLSSSHSSRDIETN